MKKIEWKQAITKTFWQSCILGLLVGCFIIIEIEYEDLGLSNIRELSFRQVLALLEGFADPWKIYILPLGIISTFITISIWKCLRYVLFYLTTGI
tara:strand:- start:59 stop:343 length:285 start_codon:yes stop_codon:yes gene_type:complete